MSVSYDTIVVGAGVSGVTTAILLAKHGRRVALVEAGPRTMPTIRGFRRRGSFWDTGFHYVGGLGEGDVLDVLFDYIGINPLIRKVPMGPAAYDVFYCRETERRFGYVSGWERLADRMKTEFPKAGPAVETYLAEVRRLYHKQPRELLTGRPSDEHIFQNMDGDGLLNYLDALTDDKDFKQVVAAHCLLYGVEPFEVPFPFHALVAGSYYESAYTIAGGGASLTSAFEQILAEHEIDIFVNCPVKRFVFSDLGRMTGVEMDDGTQLEAKAGVSTIHPRKLIEMVPERVFRPVFWKRLANLQDTSSAFMVYGKCKRPSTRLQRTNYLLFETSPIDYEMERMDVEQRPMFVASAAPGADTESNVTVICPESYDRVRCWADSCLGDRPPDYYEYKQQMVDLLTRRLASFPELDCVGFEPISAASPLTLRDYMNNPTGSLYGVKHRHGHVDLAPQTRARNLFLAGQNILTPGLMGAMLSAVLTSGYIVGFDEMHRGFHQ